MATLFESLRVIWTFSLLSVFSVASVAKFIRVWFSCCLRGPHLTRTGTSLTCDLPDCSEAAPVFLGDLRVTVSGHLRFQFQNADHEKPKGRKHDKIRIAASERIVDARIRNVHSLPFFDSLHLDATVSHLDAPLAVLTNRTETPFHTLVLLLRGVESNREEILIDWPSGRSEAYRGIHTGNEVLIIESQTPIAMRPSK